MQYLRNMHKCMPVFQMREDTGQAGSGRSTRVVQPTLSLFLSPTPRLIVFIEILHALKSPKTILNPIGVLLTLFLFHLLVSASLGVMRRWKTRIHASTSPQVSLSSIPIQYNSSLVTMTHDAVEVRE
ncbi:hypothetical protein KQX54_007546 [Cotesia glomerata]|uniref:Uncharacterized protein n=1 Tax=Cotesia glomerata TaxID=32391 RepID=A0AAV7IKA2_COTGL|nr:hypothetical protein KQX54_007546 [Cotesia glomerata]